ncbi:MAG: hypothetical protein U0869_07780 [Chloroflexota bacterium]
MASTLGRLFTYSKDTAFDAHENFCTEALAACVRLDPAPLLEALRERAVLRLGAPALEVPLTQVIEAKARTQVFHPEGGVLDFVLELRADNGARGEVWIEAKTGSPLTLRQIEAYRRDAEKRSQTDGVKRVVVALTRETPSFLVPWLDWRRLYASGRRSSSPAWADLCQFLEETDVADASYLPITDREAGSVADAAALFTKVTRVLAGVRSQVAGTWGASPYAARLVWPAEGAMLNNAGANFRSSGHMMVVGGALRFGVEGVNGTAYWLMGLRSRGESATRLEAIAKRASGRGLPSDWEVRLDGRDFLTRRVRLAAYPSADEALLWYGECIAQLQACGAVDDLMGEATPSAVAEGAATAEDGSTDERQ